MVVEHICKKKNDKLFFTAQDVYLQWDHNIQCSYYPFEKCPGVKQPGLPQKNVYDGPLGLA